MSLSQQSCGIHRPNLTSYRHESLVGKRILILGAARASHSYHIFQKARLAGTVVYIALLENHERMIRSYLDQDPNPIMHRDFHLLIVPNLFTGPDIDSIADVILDQARKANGSMNNDDAFFDACITFQDNHVQLTCDLCHLWNLPGCESDGVWSTIDKYLFRKTIQESNLMGKVRCQKMEEFIQDYEIHGNTDITFPLVLKPSAG
jgi:hypothetical protein